VIHQFDLQPLLTAADDAEGFEQVEALTTVDHRVDIVWQAGAID
jgi:hypothetical protein